MGPAHWLARIKDRRGDGADGEPSTDAASRRRRTRRSGAGRRPGARPGPGPPDSAGAMRICTWSERRIPGPGRPRRRRPGRRTRAPHPPRTARRVLVRSFFSHFFNRPRADRGKTYLVGERVCGQVIVECRTSRISRPLRRTTAGVRARPSPTRTGSSGSGAGAARSAGAPSRRIESNPPRMTTQSDTLG